MEKYDSKTRSARAFAEAAGYLPGGVNSPVRAFGGVDMTPVFIDRAAGSKIYDIDGNEYIDYVCSWGPIILGHAHPAAALGHDLGVLAEGGDIEPVALAHAEQVFPFFRFAFPAVNRNVYHLILTS